MELVKVYEIPKCKMVVSQCGMFGDGKLEKFDEWFSSLPRSIFPKDFLGYDNEQGGFIWHYVYSEEMDVPNDFDVIEFTGGLYAVASGIDGQDSTEVINTIKKFIEEKDCFEEDHTRGYLGNIITPPSAGKAMGYNQMDYYIPIRVI